MSKVVLEAIIGVRTELHRLCMDPCHRLSKGWQRGISEGSSDPRGRSLSHPFLRTKIGCIKDSCAPQETVAHIS
jgi:hypothetical protein